MLTVMMLVTMLQAGQPTVDCSLLTAAQAVGLPCAPRAPVAPAPPALPEEITGVGGNPNVFVMCPADLDAYREPDRAALCAILTAKPAPPGPAYELGKRYQHAYPESVLLVTELRLEADGRVGVGGRWVAHPFPELIGTRYWFTAGTAPFVPVRAR